MTRHEQNVKKRMLYKDRPSIESFSKHPVWAERHWMHFRSVEDIPKIKNCCSSLGFVYVAEYGELVKIGFTIYPRERFQMRYKKGLKYGGELRGCYISPAHRGYVKTENILHKHFSEFRIPGTELFKIKFGENIPTMMCMAIEQHICGSDIAEVEETDDENISIHFGV